MQMLPKLLCAEQKDDGSVGVPLDALVDDASTRQKNEEQLHQAQKMESMGRLAGGVAHDFNNLLTVILSHCDVLRAYEALSSPVREGLEEIAGAATRAADLTQQLLAFTRQQVLPARVLDLSAVVSQSLRLLHSIDMVWQSRGSPFSPNH